jgi:hypothetical protein
MLCWLARVGPRTSGKSPGPVLSTNAPPPIKMIDDHGSRSGFNSRAESGHWPCFSPSARACSDETRGILSDWVRGSGYQSNPIPASVAVIAPEPRRRVFPGPSGLGHPSPRRGVFVFPCLRGPVSRPGGGATNGARDYDARVDPAAESSLTMSLATGRYYPDAEWLEMRITPPIC